MRLYVALTPLYNTGLSQAGEPGGHVPPPFLVDQLILSQPGGGADYARHSTTSPLGFSDIATALQLFKDIRWF